MLPRRFLVFLALTSLGAQGLDAQGRRSRAPSKSPYSHNTEAVREALRPLADRHRRSVVGVFCAGKRVAFGVVVDARGHVITKASELEGDVEVQLTGSQDRLPAKVLGSDEPNDVALLKVEAKGLKPAKFLVKNKTRIGSIVTTVAQDVLPLVYGVMSVPRHPRKPRPLLGVQISKADEGIRLTRVTKGSAASEAGLKAGDIVTAIGGKKMVEDPEFRAAIVEHDYGEPMKLRVLRDGKKLNLVARLKRDSDRHGPISSQERARLWGPLSDVRLGFEEVIQHDSVMTPDQCGTPLVDLDGKIVGLNIARIGRFETVALTSKVVVAAVRKIRSHSK